MSQTYPSLPDPALGLQGIADPFLIGLIRLLDRKLPAGGVTNWRLHHLRQGEKAIDAAVALHHLTRLSMFGFRSQVPGVIGRRKLVYIHSSSSARTKSGVMEITCCLEWSPFRTQFSCLPANAWEALLEMERRLGGLDYQEDHLAILCCLPTDDPAFQQLFQYPELDEPEDRRQ